MIQRSFFWLIQRPGYKPGSRDQATGQDLETRLQARIQRPGYRPGSRDQATGQGPETRLQARVQRPG
ncbi:unnamed protein product [Gadus morhua 'NCC']